MKIRDEKETQKIKQQNKTKRKNLSFLQLICKASLNFKSNFELALSIILKQKELYERKHVAMESKCLKI